MLLKFKHKIVYRIFSNFDIFLIKSVLFKYSKVLTKLHVEHKTEKPVCTYNFNRNANSSTFSSVGLLVINFRLHIRHRCITQHKENIPCNYVCKFSFWKFDLQNFSNEYSKWSYGRFRYQCWRVFSGVDSSCNKDFITVVLRFYRLQRKVEFTEIYFHT